MGDRNRMFTREQIASFKTVGYLVVPNFWSQPETLALQKEIERLKSDGKLQNVATDGDGKTQSSVMANLQLCPMSPHSPLLRALPFSQKVIDAISDLIGDPVRLHLDQVFLKPGKHGAGTNWHQDNAYFQITDPLQGTAMWTAVHDATVANGTLKVIPGSHKTALEHSRDPQSNHHIRCYPSEELALSIELKAGGAIFFAYGVAHATGGNATDSERAGMAYHFVNKNAIDETYFGDDSGEGMKHPVLSGPLAEDGTKSYGVPIKGIWDSEVARANS